MRVLLLLFQFGFLLFLSLFWLLWPKLPELCWIVAVKVGTLGLFLTLGEMLRIDYEKVSREWSLLLGTIYFKSDAFSSFLYLNMLTLGFPGSWDGKESACNVGDQDLIPGLEWYPGEGNVSPLQYSCLENYMDGGAWQSSVHGVTKSQIPLTD